jgi:hypothetical protein
MKICFAHILGASLFGIASAIAEPPAAGPEEVRTIAKEAYIYGFPLVDSYRIQYSYFADPAGPEFKAPWNTLFHNARVYSPEDKSIQTPNAETLYSYLGADLRTEPLVFTVPLIDRNRYFSLQFVDADTFNVAYVGIHGPGSAGNYLLAGPKWRGQKPAGIKTVIPCETEFAFVLYRTQLFDPADLENVKKIQAGYKMQSLSEFLGGLPPPPPLKFDFPKPLNADEERSSLNFFSELNFILQFCPTVPSERALMARLDKIGVGGSHTFDAASLSSEMQKAFADGMADAWSTFKAYKATEIDTGKRTSADNFGGRDYLGGKYLDRFAGAVMGIYGNSKSEEIDPIYSVDENSQKLDGNNRYTLRFLPRKFPPVRAFWSLTLYEMPASLLYANPLNRYFINSNMLPSLKRDADGGITLYVQNASPGADKESNWLPAPKGPFSLVLRLYRPDRAALEGNWSQPLLKKVK